MEAIVVMLHSQAFRCRTDVCARQEMRSVAKLVSALQ